MMAERDMNNYVVVKQILPETRVIDKTQNALNLTMQFFPFPSVLKD